MRIVHILPTYNEKETIKKTLVEYRRVIKSLPEYEHLILVVDDNSPDGTGKIVKRLSKKHRDIRLLSGPKKGLGEALIRAFRFSINKLQAEIIIPNDADLQYNPKDIPRLLQKIDEGFDVVVASRHVKGGKVVGWSWFRRLNHEISNTILAWYVAGVHEVRDHAGNFKAIRVKSVLDKVSLEKISIVGYAFQLRILYELSKTTKKFCEVPVVFQPRVAGCSKVGLNKYYFRDVFEYIKGAVEIRIDRNQQFFRYFVVGVVSFIINGRSSVDLTKK